MIKRIAAAILVLAALYVPAALAPVAAERHEAPAQIGVNWNSEPPPAPIAVNWSEKVRRGA